MTAAEILLSRLDRVRPSGPGRWMACCPAHEDKNPSLSICETDNGRVLLNDFGQGCGAADIVAAIGLTLADLFPDRPEHHIPAKRDRKHFHAAREALKTLHLEVLVVAVASENVAAGVVLDAEDRERLIQAASRIRAAAEVAA